MIKQQVKAMKKKTFGEYETETWLLNLEVRCVAPSFCLSDIQIWTKSTVGCET